MTPTTPSGVTVKLFVFASVCLALFIIFMMTVVSAATDYANTIATTF